MRRYPEAVVRAGRCSSWSPPSLAVLAMVPVAGAHARLITTEPANDAVLEQSPRSVLLRFDEPVETAFGAIRVYDARARRVDSGDVERPSDREARISVDRRLARGTYTATWRAVSADGHPVSGAFVFHVGAPGANPAGVAAQVLEGRHADVGVRAVLDRAGARLPAAAPGRRRHADARRRPRPGRAEDTLAALPPAHRRLAAAGARGARRHRPSGCGCGWLRSSATRCIGTSSRRCWERGSARSGSCSPGWRWPVRCCSSPVAASRC